MNICSVCAYRNTETSLYCERCGNTLQSSTPYAADYTLTGIRSTPAPPPPPIQTNPISSLPSSTVAYISHHQETSKPYLSHMFGSMLLSIILYLIGSLSTALGILMGFSTIATFDSLMPLVLILFLASIAFLIVLLKRHRSPRLYWWKRLLWWLGITIVISILMILGGVILEGMMGQQVLTSVMDIYLGSFFIFYGILGSWIALW